MNVPELDQQSGVPLYRQIKDILRHIYADLGLKAEIR